MIVWLSMYIVSFLFGISFTGDGFIIMVGLSVFETVIELIMLITLSINKSIEIIKSRKNVNKWNIKISHTQATEL